MVHANAMPSQPRTSRRRLRLWALSVLAGLSGCACPDVTTAFAISETEFDRLTARYGSEALPEPECERLCIESQTPTPPPCPRGGAGGAAASGGAGGLGSGGSGGAAIAGSAGVAGSEAGVAGSGGALPRCPPRNRFSRISECQLGTIAWTQHAVICTGVTEACDG